MASIWSMSEAILAFTSSGADSMRNRSRCGVRRSCAIAPIIEVGRGRSGAAAPASVKACDAAPISAEPPGSWAAPRGRGQVAGGLGEGGEGGKPPCEQ